MRTLPLLRVLLRVVVVVVVRVHLWQGGASLPQQLAPLSMVAGSVRHHPPHHLPAQRHRVSEQALLCVSMSCTEIFPNPRESTTSTFWEPKYLDFLGTQNRGWGVHTNLRSACTDRVRAPWTACAA